MGCQGFAGMVLKIKFLLAAIIPLRKSIILAHQYAYLIGCDSFHGYNNG